MSSAVIRISSYESPSSNFVPQLTHKQVATQHFPLQRTWFYKADWFPEVIVNPNREYKDLKHSCKISMP